MTFELLLLRGKLPLTTPPPTSAVVACLSLADFERGHLYYVVDALLGQLALHPWLSLLEAIKDKRLGCWPGSTSRELRKRVRPNSQNFQFTKQNGEFETPLFNFSCFLKTAILSLFSVYALFHGSLCVEWANSTQMSPILMSKTNTVDNCHYFLNLTRSFGWIF